MIDSCIFQKINNATLNMKKGLRVSECIKYFKMIGKVASSIPASCYGRNCCSVSYCTEIDNINIIKTILEALRKEKLY